MSVRIDLVREVLEQLGLTAAGQDIAAEDAEVVDRRIDPKLAELDLRDVVTVNAADFDDALLEPLGAIIAASCARVFGIAGNDLAEAQGAAQQGERTINLLLRGRHPGPVRAQYF